LILYWEDISWGIIAIYLRHLLITAAKTLQPSISADYCKGHLHWFTLRIAQLHARCHWWLRYILIFDISASRQIAVAIYASQRWLLEPLINTNIYLSFHTDIIYIYTLLFIYYYFHLFHFCLIFTLHFLLATDSHFIVIFIISLSAIFPYTLLISYLDIYFSFRRNEELTATFIYYNIDVSSMIILRHCQTASFTLLHYSPRIFDCAFFALLMIASLASQARAPQPASCRRRLFISPTEPAMPLSPFHFAALRAGQPPASPIALSSFRQREMLEAYLDAIFDTELGGQPCLIFQAIADISHSHATFLRQEMATTFLIVSHFRLRHIWDAAEQLYLISITSHIISYFWYCRRFHAIFAIRISHDYSLRHYFSRHYTAADIATAFVKYIIIAEGQPAD